MKRFFKKNGKNKKFCFEILHFVQNKLSKKLSAIEKVSYNEDKLDLVILQM